MARGGVSGRRRLALGPLNCACGACMCVWRREMKSADSLPVFFFNLDPSLLSPPGRLIPQNRRTLNTSPEMRLPRMRKAANRNATSEMEAFGLTAER